jgi:hypothetical protein
MIFGVKLLTMDLSPGFLDLCTFNRVLYWALVVVFTTWYVSEHGFMSARRKRHPIRKPYKIILACIFPFIVGLCAGFVFYILISIPLMMFKAMCPYIVVFLLIVSLFYVTRVLNGLYFKSIEMVNPFLRKALMGFALLAAFCVFLFSMVAF